MKFWTNALVYRDDVLLRGVEGGRRFKRAVQFQPRLFTTPCPRETGFKTLDGEPVLPRRFDTIREARDYIKDRKGVPGGGSVYGYDKWQYCYLAEEYPGQVRYDLDMVRVAVIDIETEVGDAGFPSPEVAAQPVTAITFKVGDQFYAFGTKEYAPRDDTLYFQCRDEKELLRSFLKTWSEDHPDVITGWNIEGFDVPYLVNRIRRVLGESEAKKLSPWRFLSERTFEFRGRNQTVYVPVGISVLDYQRVFHKHGVMTRAVDTPDDYKLNTIAHVHLDERKIDYSEYEGLMDLHDRDYQKFMDYNIHDVELVAKLEKKFGFIRQIMESAYYAKANYEDMLGTVKPIECILHHKGLEQGIVMPLRERHEKKELVGGFVKDPGVGSFEWVVSEDLDSLYSHLTMQFNISPETKRGSLLTSLSYSSKENAIASVGMLVDGYLHQYLDEIRHRDVICAANMALYSREKGFIPRILEEMYDIRVKSKFNFTEAQKRYEETKEAKWADEMARWKSSDKVLKTFLNGFYGVVTNEFFLFYDHQNAEAITTSGQLAARWIEKAINTWLNGILGTDSDYIVAMDTDSVYVNFGPLVDKVCKGKTKDQIVTFLDEVCKTKLKALIEKSYGEMAEYVNAVEQKMSMKRESITSRAIWTGKKNYILYVHDKEGTRYQKPKIEAKGIKAIKSNTPPSCRKKIKEALELIMSGTEEQVVDLARAFRAEFETLPFDDVAFPSGVNELTKYQDEASIWKHGAPAHVRGALLYNHIVRKQNLRYPLVFDGDKIRWAYVFPNALMSRVFATPGPIPRSLNIEQILDRDLMYEVGFVQPLKAILDAVGWTIEKVASLEELVGKIKPASKLRSDEIIQPSSDGNASLQAFFG